MKRYILAHDLGTSGNKASLMDREGRLVSSVTLNYGTDYLGDNRVEQNPEDWWKAVIDSTALLLKEVKADEIGGISFSGQMMGCLITDGKGIPRHNSLIWADQRSMGQINRLMEKIDPRRFYLITGHRLSSPSYSMSKYLWLRENHPELTEGEHKLLNAKDYIVYKLTGRFCTDYSDAGGTHLFDLTSLSWSEEILEVAGIDRKILPDAVPSTETVGSITAEAAALTGLKQGTPVIMGAGDGVAAAVGAGCLKPGDCYNYIGSSSWIATTTDEPLFDGDQRTFNWPHITEGLYTPCGTTQSGGGAVSWMKRELADCDGHKVSYDRINELIASSEPGARGILFLPHLLGERSPVWNSDARGAFFGLAMDHTRADIFRSVMEGVSLNLGWIFDCLVKEGEAQEVTMIGGGAQSENWTQMLADIYDRPLKIPGELEEATSLGAAAIGAIGAGMIKDASEIPLAEPIVRRVLPDPSRREIYKKQMDRFIKLYEALEPLY